MIDLHDEDARKIGSGPLLIKLVRLFLLDAIVSGKVKALAVIRLEIWIGRLGAETMKIIVEMIFKNRQRKMCVGMRIKTFGHEHVGAQIHRAAPEFRQQL